jgi:putative Mn2+ efflux pump MntP
MDPGWTDLIFVPLAVSLGIDAFSVALGAGVFPTDDEARRTFRLVFHFGFFQGGMTLLGWFGGRTIEPLIASVDHWVAFALLAYVGGRMLRTAFRKDADHVPEDPSRGKLLVLMSVGTSIDALAVGLSLALAGTQILGPSLLIGIVAAVMTYVGLKLGHKLGLWFGQSIQFVGGVVLLLIGVRVLISHLGL